MGVHEIAPRLPHERGEPGDGARAAQVNEIQVPDLGRVATVGLDHRAAPVARHDDLEPVRVEPFQKRRKDLFGATGPGRRDDA